MTAIEWTDVTWNPVTGCTEKSPGCANCYARSMHQRLTAMGQVKYSRPFHEVSFHRVDLGVPLHWRKPRRVFINSMSDLFHSSVTNEQIAAVYGIACGCPQHIFQIVTKRPERAVEWYSWLFNEDLRRRKGPDFICQQEAYNLLGDEFPLHPVKGTLKERPWPLPNVHLIATCEDQQRADERIPLLLRCPAAVRGVSLEPLLGPVNISRYMWPVHWRWDAKYKTPEAAIAAGAEATRHRQCLVSSDCVFLDWVIVGCESGPKRRPCDWHWQAAIVDQCRRAGVPVFVKQISVDVGVGGGRPYHRHWLTRVSKDPTECGGWPADLRVRMFPGEKWQ